MTAKTTRKRRLKCIPGYLADTAGFLPYATYLLVTSQSLLFLKHLEELWTADTTERELDLHIEVHMDFRVPHLLADFGADNIAFCARIA